MSHADPDKRVSYTMEILAGNRNGAAAPLFRITPEDGPPVSFFGPLCHVSSVPSHIWCGLVCGPLQVCRADLYEGQYSSGVRLLPTLAEGQRRHLATRRA